MQYIPGPEALLAPAAKEITAGVLKFLNPNREFQEGMQRALATNPDLIPQLSDIEHAAPGTLDRLGFGPLAGVIAQMPESPESQFKRENRGKIQKNQELNLSNEVSKNENLEKVLREAAGMLAQNSTMTADAAYQMLMGQTKAQTRTQNAQATKAEADASTAPAEARVREQELKLQGDLLSKTIHDLPEVGKIDLYDLARNMRRGKLTDYSIVASVYNTPGVKDTFSAILDKMDRDDSIEAQRTMYDMREGATDTDKLDSYFLQRAATFFEETNGTGSIHAWKRYFQMGSEERETIKELAKKPIDQLSFDDRELVEVYNARNKLATEQSVATTRVFNKDFMLMLGRLETTVRGSANKSAENPMISGALQEMNALLAERAAVTGRNVRVQFGKIPGSDAGWLKVKKETGFYFVDDEGNPLEVGDITMAGTSTTDEGDITQSVEYQRALAELMNMDAGTRNTQLERIKRGRPEMYDSLNAHFARKK